MSLTNSFDHYELFDYQVNVQYALNKSCKSVLDKSVDELNEPDLLLAYQRHLIRYEIVKRLNDELQLARKTLHKCIKSQLNVERARERVSWLENEIESIILANKHVTVPMDSILDRFLVLNVFIEHQDQISHAKEAG
jgi:hypothetical protein